MLLHGYLSDRRSFYYQVECLSQNGFRCIAPDMPCFGTSARTAEPWSVGDYATWLKAFISSQRLQNVYIVAHSFGARVAIKLLSRHTQLCQKLVIVGGAGIVKPRSKQYLRSVRRYRRIKKFMPRYAERHFGSVEYRTLPPVMKESYKLVVNEDLKCCAAKIGCPTLLIYGADDKVTPPNEEGATFNRLIKGSELKIIEGGHFCFCENYLLFNKLLLDFFN